MDFTQSYFSLFDLPQQFELNTVDLAERYRHLQRRAHPDKFAGASAQEQRVAVQFSAFINEAFDTLKQPLTRALYLLEIAGWDGERVASQKLAGDFLMEQMELREKLESLHNLVEPDTLLEHFMDELARDWAQHSQTLTKAMEKQSWEAAAVEVVKMQYLDKLRAEAELLESTLLDS